MTTVLKKKKQIQHPLTSIILFAKENFSHKTLTYNDNIPSSFNPMYNVLSSLVKSMLNDMYYRVDNRYIHIASLNTQRFRNHKSHVTYSKQL